MEEIKSILDIDRNYTLIFIEGEIKNYMADILNAEISTGQKFKAIEVKGKLSDKEKEHLFNILPHRSFKGWLKENTEYYIDRSYRTMTDTLVRFAIDMGIKDIDKKKVEDRGIQGAKNIYEMCKPMIQGYLERTFEKDLSNDLIIAKKKDDDIIYVSLNSRVIVLTPKTALFWDEETGYSLFEFLIEAMAMDKGVVKYKKHGVNVVSVASKEHYDKLVNNGNRLIVDLWGGWCEPCRLFEKLITPYLKEHNDITLVKISTDFNEWTRDILKKYGSRGIPLIVLIDEGYDLPIKGYYDEMIKKEIDPFFSSKTKK